MSLMRLGKHINQARSDVKNPDDWSYRHIWAMMPALYFAGLWRAKRRYE